MFETGKINYKLNEGKFLTYNNKAELHKLFLRDFYYFVLYHEKNNLNISLEDYLAMPFISQSRLKVGEKILPQHFLEDNIPIKHQTGKCFIGYCLIQGLYNNLIGHLMAFFYRWRDLEEVDGTPKDLSIDFFYSSWAAYVDTCKYFCYNNGDDIVKNKDSGLCARDLAILELLEAFPLKSQSIPYKTNRHTDVILPVPVKEGFSFEGWYQTADFQGENQKAISKDNKSDLTLYAKWKKLN